jgi:hypothetical protein
VKPVLHAKNSVKRHGGEIDEYLKIHEWLDQTKICVPDMRHRAILHSSFGIYLATDFFGDYFTNSVGKIVSVRDICEEHVIEDMGRIPTMEDYLREMPLYDWLGGPRKTTRVIKLAD